MNRVSNVAGCALNDHFICGHFIDQHSDLFVNIIGFPDPFCFPICIRRVHYFLPCGQNGLNQLTRMRRGRSNKKKTPKGVSSSKNNRQLATTRPFRDSCIRSKLNSYHQGTYLLSSVYPQGSKTLHHAYGPRCTSRVHRLYTCTSTRTRPRREHEPVWPSGKALGW